MREILFRGKSKTTGKWFYGNLFVEDAKGRTHVGITTKACFNIDPETVGQFTGMTDKNGTKIFEGDILLEKGKVNNGDTGAIDVESKRIVSIENAADGYMCIVSNYRSLVHHKTIEVIGNIHENKELLK